MLIQLVFFGNKVNKEAVIALNGTDSGAIDLEGMKEIGLIIPTIDTGNVSFKVSASLAGTYVVLKSKGGLTVEIDAGVGGFAVGSDDLKPLIGYRFVRVVAATQTSGAVTFTFTGKG